MEKQWRKSADESLRLTPKDDGVEKVIITVLGQDRVGIIYAVTGILAQAGANVLDIHQTLFGELFSMNMVVDISGVQIPFEELKVQLATKGEEMNLQILAQHEKVFRYMHRI